MDPTEPDRAPDLLTPPDDPARRWGATDVVVGLVVAFFAAILLSFVYATVVGGSSGSGDRALGSVVVGLVGFWAGFGGAPFVAARRRGSGSLARDFGLRFRLPGDVLRGLGIGLAGQLVLVNLIYLPLRWLDPHAVERVSDPAKEITGSGHGWGLLALAVVICIGAPVFEELFFRGLLLRSVEARLGPRWAVVVSAVVFGLVHFEPLQTPALIAFGLVLGTVAVRTRRLGPTICAHAAFNGVTVLLLALG